MKKLLSLAITLLTVFALQGCARIETGSVGILKHWGGSIDSAPATGFVVTILDSIVAEVDTTETRVHLAGLRPSDSNGVLLDGLDVVVSFKIAADKVPAFYIQTKEVDRYKDDAGREVETVGLQVLQNIVTHAVQEATKKEVMTKLASDLSTYEASILAQAQSELNTGYPGIFTIVRVNVNHFTPPASILEQANRTASLKMEAARIVQEEELIVARTKLEADKAGVEAHALAEAVKTSGMTAAELIAWKNARAYEAQAAAIGATATRTIDATKQPAAK